MVLVIDLLPQNESQALKLTAEGALRFLNLDLEGIDLNPPSASASLLPTLAFELDAEVEALSESERRALLGDALQIRYMEGGLHATTVALQVIFGERATLRRWFEEGAYTSQPHHFDMVIEFDEAFPAEFFLAHMDQVKSLLRYAQKISAYFHFYSNPTLPGGTVNTQGALLWDF